VDVDIDVACEDRHAAEEEQLEWHDQSWSD
jgi:hypothetical protein